ncbi:hypothetical protein ABG768_009440, partial [Culter alburnus]
KPAAPSPLLCGGLSLPHRSASDVGLNGPSYGRNYGRGEGLITVINPARTWPRRARHDNEGPLSEF